MTARWIAVWAAVLLIACGAAAVGAYLGWVPFVAGAVLAGGLLVAFALFARRGVAGGDRAQHNAGCLSVLAALAIVIVAALFTLWALMYAAGLPISGYEEWTEIQAMHHFGSSSGAAIDSALIRTTAPAWYGPLMPGVRELTTGGTVGMVLLVVLAWLPGLVMSSFHLESRRRRRQ